MRKHFLLAIPLASLLLFAGCSCATGDCNAPVVDDCNECVAAAPAPVVVPVVECTTCDPVMPAPDCDTCLVPAAAARIEIADAGVNIEAIEKGASVELAAAPAQEGAAETLTAEEYLALISAGKVTDPDYRAPGSISAGDAESVELASIPARFQPMTMDAEVEAVAVAATQETATYGESTAFAKEMPVTSDELTTPALMNAAALREANLAGATVVATSTTAPAITSTAAVPQIPGMPLPDGWAYIDEQDLGATTTAEPSTNEDYFSTLVGSGNANDI